jgi:outer membrane beta-barrel protein
MHHHHSSPAACKQLCAACKGVVLTETDEQETTLPFSDCSSQKNRDIVPAVVAEGSNPQFFSRVTTRALHLGQANWKGFSMKQARCGLLVAAALTLLSTSAFAQGGRKPAGGKPAPTAPPATAPAAGAAGAGGDIELDEPAKPTDQPSGDTGATGGAGGGICEIDPSACPKQGDIGQLSKRDVRAEVYAVQQIYALRRGRFELNPYWAFSLNDQFVTHPGPGLGVNYYLTNVLAVGLTGTYYQPFNGDSDFNFNNRRATRLAVPLNEYQLAGSVNFTYVPMYGKFSGFNQFIFHYDGFITAGVGAIRSRPLAVIDPDNRKFDWQTNAAFNLGFGLRIFLNRWFAVTTELRGFAYPELIENTTVAATTEQQRDPKTWDQGKELTVGVQAQLGISVFLPFSWEYRLPK